MCMYACTRVRMRCMSVSVCAVDMCLWYRVDTRRLAHTQTTLPPSHTLTYPMLAILHRASLAPILVCTSGEDHTRAPLFIWSRINASNLAWVPDGLIRDQMNTGAQVRRVS